TGNMDEWLIARITKHLAAIKFAEVDGFGSVAVRLGPTLRNFVNHPRRQLVFTLAHDGCGTKQQFCAIRGRRVFPSLESFCSFVDGATRQFFCCLVEASDYLGAIGGIDTVEQVAGLDAFAADDEWILASEFAPHLLNRLAHRRGVLFFR